MAKETIKQVDVMGLMGALKTEGRAKLSDFATPVGEPEQDVSPVLKTFREQKAKNPGTLLLFRCGDFYETYCDDAVEASKILGITLTHKDGYDMAGFPHHALDTYLPRLIRAGKRVAICEAVPNTNETKQEDKNMRLNLNANNPESANVQAAAQVNNATPQAPAIEDAVAEEIKDVSVDEVQDVVPAKPAVTVPLDNGGAPKGGKKSKPKKSEPKPDPEAVGELAGMLTKLTFGTYKTKKGNDAPIITGFSDKDDPRWKKLFDAKPKWASAGYRRDLDGNMTYHVLFGTKYMAVAKALCEAYNTTDRQAWAKAEAACAANYDGIVSGFKAEREARKAAKAAEKPAAKSAAKAKTYTESEIADLLRRAAKRDKAAMSVISDLMGKAA